MSRELIRRTTAMTDAFVSMLEKQGVDTSSARMPTKREPTWSVTRRRKAK